MVVKRAGDDPPMVVCYQPGHVPMMEDPDKPGTLIPDDTWLITEDGKPVDDPITEKEYRLLTEPLYTNWSGPDGKTHFMVMANVGLFFSPTEPPLVPDCMLILNPSRPTESKGKRIRSYFVWRYKKIPNVAIEVVSNRKGREMTFKFKKYAEIGVDWYVVFDPRQILSKNKLRIFQRQGDEFQPFGDSYFPEVGLGLTLWKGDYENFRNETLLRWCDRDGRVIPTGAETALAYHDVAERERQRADRLAAKVRDLGIDPSTNGDSKH